MAYQGREWFFEQSQKIAGRGSRFLTGDRPTEDTFRDLLQSVLMKSVSSDNAKKNGSADLPDVNGHVVLADDDSIQNKVDELIDRSVVPTPANLPETIEGGSVSSEFTGSGITVNEVFTSPRYYYEVSLSAEFLAYVETLGGSDIGVGNDGDILVTVPDGMGGLIADWRPPTGITDFTTLYVDSQADENGNGSITQPFKTIDDAYEVSNADRTRRYTINIRGGEYEVKTNLWANADYIFDRGVLVKINNTDADSTIGDYLFHNVELDGSTEIRNFHPNIFGFAKFGDRNNRLDGGLLKVESNSDNWAAGSPVMTVEFLECDSLYAPVVDFGYGGYDGSDVATSSLALIMQAPGSFATLTGRGQQEADIVVVRCATNTLPGRVEIIGFNITGNAGNPSPTLISYAVVHFEGFAWQSKLQDCTILVSGSSSSSTNRPIGLQIGNLAADTLGCTLFISNVTFSCAQMPIAFKAIYLYNTPKQHASLSNMSLNNVTCNVSSAGLSSRFLEYYALFPLSTKFEVGTATSKFPIYNGFSAGTTPQGPLTSIPTADDTPFTDPATLGLLVFDVGGTAKGFIGGQELSVV